MRYFGKIGKIQKKNKSVKRYHKHNKNVNGQKYYETVYYNVKICFSFHMVLLFFLITPPILI